MSSQRRRQPQLVEHAAAAPQAPTSIWESIVLLPNPLPDFPRNTVDTSLRLFGRVCALPLLLQTDHSTEHDAIRLVAAAEWRDSFVFSLGDLTSIVGDRTSLSRLVTVTDTFEPATLVGEISVAALTAGSSSTPLGIGAVASVVHTLRLRALIVRFDFAEAAEIGLGDLDPTRATETINALKDAIGCPVLVRAANGFPRNVARRFVQLGASGLVTGAAKPVDLRPDGDSPNGAAPKSAFTPSGIPPAAGIRMLRGIGVPIICEARFDDGGDVAKAIALGANLIAPQGIFSSLPVDEAGALDRWVATFARDLETAMFHIGARTLAQLRQAPFVATGETREWLEAAETLWKTDPRDE